MESSHDISGIKNRIHDLEEAIQEERKINIKLKREEETKSELIARVDESLAAITEQHRWAMMEMKHKKNNLEETLQDDQEEFQERMSDIAIEIAAYGQAGDDNDPLHARLKEVARVYYADKAIWQEEVRAMKKQHFDLRMQMDKILRKTLRGFKDGYRDNAHGTMDEHVRRARRENESLRRERNKQNATVNHMMQKQAEGYEKKKRAHMEMEVMATAAHFQRVHADNLGDKVRSRSTHYETLVKTFAELSDHVEEVKMQFDKKVDLADDLKAGVNTLDLQRSHRDAVRRDLIRCIQDMIKDAIHSTEKQREQESDDLIEQVLGPGGVESVQIRRDRDPEPDDDTLASFREELLDMVAVQSTVARPYLTRSMTSIGHHVDPSELWDSRKVSNAEAFSAPLSHFLRISRR